MGNYTSCGMVGLSLKMKDIINNEEITLEHRVFVISWVTIY